MKIVPENVCRLNENNFFFHFKSFLRKLWCVCNNVQNFGIAREFRDDSMIERIRFAYSIIKTVIRTQTVIIVNS